MSVIVKGMEMPKNCGECRIYCKEFVEVNISNNDFHTKRLENCPLVALPEKHGYWSETKGIFECSECGYSFECEGYKHYFNFCPCCGAKMESEG